MTTEEQMVQWCADAHDDATAKLRGCNGCMKYFAEKFCITVPDLTANGLVDWMSKSWTPVTKDEAQKYADAGRFVVAGKKGASGPGHVVVILPGGPIDSGGYSYKDKILPSKGKYPRCCSMSSSGSPFPGAISKGEKSAYDPWYSDQGVKYWLAPLLGPVQETRSLGADWRPSPAWM